MTEDERLQRGLEVFKATHGTVLGDPGHIDPDSFGGHVLRTVYNDVWGRTKMSMRERRLVVLGALAAQSLEWPLATHLKCAFEKGEIDREDVEEIKYLLGVYIGHPRTTVFDQVWQKAAAAAEVSVDGDDGGRQTP